jgi:membrane protein DedA with SNARE-associated domain
MHYLDRFFIFLESLPEGLVYFFLGLSAFVENLFPPAPGDTITAFGAFLVGTQRLSFFGVYLSTTLGSLAGFMLLFGAGRYLGKRFFLEKDYRFFKAKDIVRAEDWFRKYGYKIVLANRFLPGLRSVISLAGGITNLKTLKVACMALVSAAIWNLIWIWAGYMLGNNWDTVRGRMADMMAHYNLVVFLALGVVIVFLIIKALTRRRRGD